MAQVALDPAYRRISVEEFLEFDLCGAPAELDDGLIRMLAGATEAQARISGNILAFLAARLRGSGLRAYGFGLGVRTGERTVRSPSGSVYRYDPAADETRKLLGDPLVVIEALSPFNQFLKQTIKLPEYLALAGVTDIVFVDPIHQRTRHVRRNTDEWLEPGSDLVLSSIDVTIPHAEIFADD